MRNLKVCSETHVYIPATSGSYRWMTDSPDGSLFCGLDKGVFEVHENSRNFRETVLPDGGGHVIGSEHLTAENGLFVALSDGMLSVSSEAQTFVVCEIPSNITACKWSPDQEILVLTTLSQEDGANLMLLSADWNIVTTQLLDPTEFGELTPQTVGWGKKETQFHGSEGKNAAKIKCQTFIPVDSDDDKLPRISWRADGQFFAVSSVDPSSSVRVIRVYDRQGFLQSTSEAVSGLQGCLAWKPSGSLVASSVRTSTNFEVVFFEKNGLRHGEFSLLPAFPDCSIERLSVHSLSWNESSEILLVWIVDQNALAGNSDCIQLWICSNYHWYLKKSFVFTRTSTCLVSASWGRLKPYHLHFLESNGRMTSLEVMFEVCRSADPSSTVAVIDGNKVLLTSFRFSSVAPPSSAHELLIGANVNDVSLKALENGYELVVFTVRREVLLFLSDVVEPRNPPKLSAIYEFPLFGHTGIYWLSSTLLAATEPARKDETDLWGLWTFSVKKQSDDELESLPSLEFMEDNKVCKLAAYLDVPVCHMISFASVIYLFFENGTVGRYNSETGDDVKMLLKIPEKCDNFAVYPAKQSVDIFAHSSVTHRLYRNTSLISDACTSFIISNDFLLYTTHRHKLLCVPLQMEPFGVLFDEREIERGARIVTTVSGRTDVVFQLPRGNLEIIHPRSLVLSQIIRLVGAKDYKEAFNLMRVHRLDMNLLVDLDPAMFLNDIPRFTKDLENSSSLNIFIASLNDDNVTATVYKNHFSKPASTIPNKRNVILDRMEKSLQNTSGDLLLSRLACYIYMKPQELEKALFEIRNLRDKPSGFPADDALKFVLYSADVDELFNIALGTYDFDLVLMIGAKSRKDPKEYIPFLNQFRAIQPEEYRRFSIDKHLKRYEKALENLALLGTEKFSELKELVVSHQLYKAGLRIYQDEGVERFEILKLYGDHLSAKKNFTEAGIVYQESKNLAEAFECFRKSANWQLALACAVEAEWDEKKMAQVCELLVLSLKSASRHAEAAIIQTDFLRDSPKAFLTLLDGHCWTEAYFLKCTKNCGPTSNAKFVSALKEASSSALERILSLESELEKHSDRLTVVRKNKLENPDTGTFGDGRDDFSETSSISEKSTRSSQGSRTTSKSRRKEEKKKRSLREGGRFEDLALLDAIKTIFFTVNGMIKEVGGLLKFLTFCKENAVGKELQTSFDKLIENCSKRKVWIWTADDLMRISSPRQNGYMFGPDATASMIAGMHNGPAGDSEISAGGEYTLADFAMFIPPDLNVSSWNECKMDHFAV